MNWLGVFGFIFPVNTSDTNALNSQYRLLPFWVRIIRGLRRVDLRVKPGQNLDVLQLL